MLNTDPKLRLFLAIMVRKHYRNGAALCEDFKSGFRNLVFTRVCRNNVLKNYDPRQLPGLPGVKSAPANYWFLIKIFATVDQILLYIQIVVNEVI